jgi:hypothetical protein
MRTGVPGVVVAYSFYCAFQVLLSGVVLPILAWLATSQPSPFEAAAATMGPPGAAMIRDLYAAEVLQARLLLFGYFGVLTAVVGGAFFLPRTPGAWIYHTVIICLGMTSQLLPISVILLIFWLQPATRAYFGRRTTG